MYLRKRSITQLYYILIPIFFLIFMVQTTNSFAATETLITGRVVKYSDPSEGIPNIKMRAFESETSQPATDVQTDPNGRYKINVSNFVSENYTTKEFYVFAEDSQMVYIAEYYGGYWKDDLDIQRFEAEEDLVHVSIDDETGNINFQLMEYGAISINLDIPYDRGYKLSLNGTINFKKTQDFPYTKEEELTQENLYTNYPDHKYTFESILPGNYTTHIADSEWTEYLKAASLTKPYCYRIDHVFSNQYYDHKSSAFLADEINLSHGQTEDITFSDLSEAEVGKIYGLIRDPNMSEIRYIQLWDTPGPAIKSSVTYNESLYTIYLNYNDNYSDKASKAIENICLKIIPSGTQQVIEPIIPTKILIDPNFCYLISGADGDGLGGYAFKFLDSGNYKMQIFRTIRNPTIPENTVVVLDVFYNGQSSIAYSQDDADEITIDLNNPSEIAKRIDIELKKVHIHGSVRDENGPINAGIYLLKTSSSENQGTQVCYRYPESSQFSFNEFISGDFIVRIKHDDYNVVRIPLSNVKLGDEYDLGNITLEPYEPCPSDKHNEISGRIFLDEDPNIGLENIQVRVVNIENINDSRPSCLLDTTNANGEYSIPHLPDSVFIAFIEDTENLPYCPEMHRDIIMSLESKEHTEISNMLDLFVNDPSNTEDPNIIAELIDLSGEGPQTATVNFGLSEHKYHFCKGLNLYAHPGEPCPEEGGTIETFLVLEVLSSSFQKLISLEPLSESNKIWEVQVYRNPNSIPGQDNFIMSDPKYKIKTGHGYMLYVNDDVTIPFPPFRIYPPEINLGQGPNLISMPDLYDKNIYSQDVINNFNFNEENASSINHFNCQSGKWKSTTSLWGLSAGNNFKIKRHQGYMVYMKKEIPSWKSPNEWHN